MTLQALIFDVDGTLADTEEAHRQAFNGAFARHGYNWRWDTELYRDLLNVTGGRERIEHYIRSLGMPPTRQGECLAEIADMHTTKNCLYTHAVASGKVQLRPGVERLLREAREQSLSLGIATTTSPDNVTALIHSTLGDDAHSWFATVVTGDRVFAKKPDPEVYVIALQELGLPASAAIAFEDSANGLAAALGAGVATVITPSQWTRHEGFDGALCILSDLNNSEDRGKSPLSLQYLKDALGNAD